MREAMCRGFIFYAVILLVTGLPSWGLEATHEHAQKIWYMGRVISVGDGEICISNEMAPESNRACRQCDRNKVRKEEYLAR